MSINGLLGGMGLLLFGLYIFEEMLKFLGGKNLRRVIVKYTTGSWQSLLVGMVLAGIFSSSSLLTLLVIALTGAGLMPLKNAIGIVIGSNIGTTFDDFLIAWLGFGSGVDIGAFALPMVGVAGIASVLIKNEHVRSVAKLIFGFGLMFIGLFFIKQTAGDFGTSFSFDSLQSTSLWVFGLAGMGVTAMVQLMGVVALMTFSALDAHIITFPAAIAILMGANIGATVNAILASLGGRSIKRQVALSHVIFNGTSSLLGAIFFWQLIWITTDVFGFGEDVVGSAFFNVIFNLSTAILFGFFLSPFTRLIERIIPAHNDDVTKLTVEQFSLHEITSSSIEPITTALTNDIRTMMYLLTAYFFHTLGTDKDDAPMVHERLEQAGLKKYIEEISTETTDVFEEKTNLLLQYYIRSTKYRLHQSQFVAITELYKALNALIKSKKTFDLCIKEINLLKGSTDELVTTLHTMIINKLRNTMYAVLLLLQTQHEGSITEVDSLENQLSVFHEELSKVIGNTMKQAGDEAPISEILTISSYFPLSLTYFLSAVRHEIKSSTGSSSFPKW